MTWYAANIVTTIQLLETDQASWPVEIQTYLIDAKDESEALNLAEEFGKEEAVAGSDGLTWNNRPARTLYLGIVRLNLLYPPVSSHRVLGNGIPEHGAEITHFKFEVGTLQEAKALAEGNSVQMQIWEQEE